MTQAGCDPVLCSMQAGQTQIGPTLFNIYGGLDELSTGVTVTIKLQSLLQSAQPFMLHDGGLSNPPLCVWFKAKAAPVDLRKFRTSRLGVASCL